MSHIRRPVDVAVSGSGIISGTVLSEPVHSAFVAAVNFGDWKTPTKVSVGSLVRQTLVLYKSSITAELVGIVEIS